MMNTETLEFQASDISIVPTNTELFEVTCQIDIRDVPKLIEVINITDIVDDLKDELLDEIGAEYANEYFKNN